MLDQFITAQTSFVLLFPHYILIKMILNKLEMWTKAVNKLKLWLVNVELAKFLIPICFTLSVQQDDKQSVDYTSHPLRGLGLCVCGRVQNFLETAIICV